MRSGRRRYHGPPVFRTVLTCNGLTEKEGISAQTGIKEEFSHRPWQHCVHCIWEGQRLRLTLENDFDSSGVASLG
jgi:hypothetical protein